MRAGSVEGPHSQSHAVATLHAVGKINKGIREYQNPTPVKLYIQLGRSTQGIREYQNPTPVKLYIQLGRSTKVLYREY